MLDHLTPSSLTFEAAMGRLSCSGTTRDLDCYAFSRFGMHPRLAITTGVRRLAEPADSDMAELEHVNAERTAQSTIETSCLST